MSDELLEVKPEFMGFQMKGYPGAFPPKVEDRIRKIVASPCLHLFSGTSKIGDVRVDLARPEATINQDVFKFIETDARFWEFVVADPPYTLSRPEIYNIPNEYANSKPLNRVNQNQMGSWLKAHTNNVLWFDITSPCPRGFYRHKTWLYLLGSWHNVRVLTWLKRKGERLDALKE